MKAEGWYFDLFATRARWSSGSASVAKELPWARRSERVVTSRESGCESN